MYFYVFIEETYSPAAPMVTELYKRENKIKKTESNKSN